MEVNNPEFVEENGYPSGANGHPSSGAMPSTLARPIISGSVLRSSKRGVVGAS